MDWTVDLSAKPGKPGDSRIGPMPDRCPAVCYPAALQTPSEKGGDLMSSIFPALAVAFGMATAVAGGPALAAECNSQNGCLG